MKTKTIARSLALLSMVSAVASADSVNIHQYHPTANFSYMFSEDALMRQRWGKYPQDRMIFGAQYDYVHRPLVELDSTRTSRVRDIVKDMHSLNLVFGYNILDDLQVGADTSLTNVYFPDGTSNVGLGESRLFGKYRLNSDKAPVTFAVVPEITIPTGQKNYFLSSGSFGGGAKLVAEHDFKEIIVAANLGYHFDPSATYRDLNMKSSIPMSLSVLVPIGSRWGVNAEANANLLLPFSNYSTPSAFYLGGRYKIPGDLYINFGGALGSTNAYSSANVRAIVGLTYAPYAGDEPAPAPKPAPVPTPTPTPAPRVVFTKKEVVIKEEIKFHYNQALLTPEGRNLVDEVAKVMRDNDRFYDTILIEGHTDENGTIAYNLKLSEQRAEAVMNYLVSKGVKPSKLKSSGYGKSRFKATKVTVPNKAARDAINRRVEFRVLQTSEETKKAVEDMERMNENNQTLQEEISKVASGVAAKKAVTGKTKKPVKPSKKVPAVKSKQAVPPRSGNTPAPKSGSVKAPTPNSPLESKVPSSGNAPSAPVKSAAPAAPAAGTVSH